MVMMKTHHVPVCMKIWYTRYPQIATLIGTSMRKHWSFSGTLISDKAISFTVTGTPMFNSVMCSLGNLLVRMNPIESPLRSQGQEGHDPKIWWEILPSEGMVCPQARPWGGRIPRDLRWVGHWEAARAEVWLWSETGEGGTRQAGMSGRSDHPGGSQKGANKKINRTHLSGLKILKRWWVIQVNYHELSWIIYVWPTKKI